MVNFSNALHTWMCLTFPKVSTNTVCTYNHKISVEANSAYHHTWWPFTSPQTHKPLMGLTKASSTQSVKQTFDSSKLYTIKNLQLIQQLKVKPKPARRPQHAPRQSTERKNRHRLRWTIVGTHPVSLVMTNLEHKRPGESLTRFEFA